MQQRTYPTALQPNWRTVTLVQVHAAAANNAVTGSRLFIWPSEFDFTITGSGEASGISYSAGMTIHEGGIDDTARAQYQ